MKKTKSSNKLIEKIKIKKNLSIRTLLIIAIMFLILSLIFVINFLGNRNANVYYRTYTKKNGWSDWSRDGVTSGNKKDDIINIQVKVNHSDDKNNYITYNLYSNDEWTGNYTSSSKIKNQKIKGIKMSGSKKIISRYEICYRTFNKTNKWLEWTCGPSISGNKNENVKAIEVKLIPKGAVKYDYLEDYNTKIISNVGF